MGWAHVTVWMKAVESPVFETGYLYKALDEALAKFAKLVHIEFGRTTRTWEEDVVFEIVYEPGIKPFRTRTRTAVVGFAVRTANKIWNWVDAGTKPHGIDAKNAPFLVFGWPSRPKTRPGSTESGESWTGPNVARLTHVDHPGTEPRKFGEQIRDKLEATYSRMMRRAWLKGTEEDRMWGNDKR